MASLGADRAAIASQSGQMHLTVSTDPLTPKARHIHGQGTPEATWRRWNTLQQLPPLSLARLAPPGAHVVVVAPHPDDEVLGCGGALSMLSRAGRSIHVIGVTDGEASHAGSPRWPPQLLGAARRTERQAGLERLGHAVSAVSLEIPDGHVQAFEERLAAALERVLEPGDTVLTTWRFDGHPDHEATARATLLAASRVGCRCWQMPVWMWHWAAPGDARVPWERLHRLELTPMASQAKARAIAAHDSQLQPIERECRPAVLPDWALARLLRPFETFFEPENIS